MVLAAGFEATSTLHVNVQRIARLLFAFQEAALTIEFIPELILRAISFRAHEPYPARANVG
jgi:hypothetical protein